MSDIFWQVICVFDPDQSGQDFAYTVGLDDRGLPDLHMWARPTHGDDVGVDFELTQRDMGHLLNRFASELVAGDLDVGATRDVEVDAAATTLKFEATGPVPKEDVDAFQSRNENVIAMRWTLHRAPVGAPRELETDEKAVWAERIAARWKSRTSVPNVPGPHVPASFDVTRDLGPLEDWVHVLAHDVGALDVDDLVVACLETYDDAAIAIQISVARAKAREVGRVDAVEAALRLAELTASSIIDRPQWGPAMEAIASEVDVEVGMVEATCRRHVLTTIAALLTCASLADVLERDVVTAVDTPFTAAGMTPAAFA